MRPIPFDMEDYVHSPFQLVIIVALLGALPLLYVLRRSRVAMFAVTAIWIAFVFVFAQKMGMLR